MATTLTAFSLLLLAAVFVLQLVLLVRRRDSDSAAALLSLQSGLERIERSLHDELAQGRAEAQLAARGSREEVAVHLKATGDSLVQAIGQLAAAQRGHLEAISGRLAELTRSNDARLEGLRTTVEAKLGQLQAENSARLEEMRKTVEEKLQGTLERRLGESFRLVSERLEVVHQGLGEMQTLAAGVGDLKRVLTNVKVRGTWGEIQLGSLLEQVLSPDQFARNVATRRGSAERVEYALRLPGREDGTGEVWLPIDAKFPREDYERLVEAADRADSAGVEQAGKQLELRLRSEAKDIRDKYLEPPATTDFAVLFLPVEGLFAEVLRRPGLVEALQRDFRVTVAGPTTLSALLNSLQMGFRTLAIQKRSSEVWEVLAAVKTEFGRFGEVIDKVQKKLAEASNAVDGAAVRSRAIERKLRGVEELPVPRAVALLDVDAEDLPKTAS